MRNNMVTRNKLAEPTSVKIEQLIENHLVQIAHRNGGWTTLYQDPIDLSYWELSYPRGQKDSSGPLLLTQVSPEIVKAKYHFLDD
jgi:hypothetical protein